MGRCPSWRLREFFFARLYVETSCLVWFGTMKIDLFWRSLWRVVMFVLVRWVILVGYFTKEASETIHNFVQNCSRDIENYCFKYRNVVGLAPGLSLGASLGDPYYRLALPRSTCVCVWILTFFTLAALVHCGVLDGSRGFVSDTKKKGARYIVFIAAVPV